MIKLPEGRPIVANNRKPWGQKDQNTSSSQSSWARDLSPKLQALRNIPAEINFERMVEARVLVSVQNADLGDFSNRVYEELEAKLLTVGGTMPGITKDDLVKYFATAIYSRVMWVNHTMDGRSFRPSDRWALPVPMSYVVSALGRVESEDGPTYVPQWDNAGDALLLDKLEWEDITRRLSALEPYGFRLVHALEKDEAGVAEVMSLLRLETSEGEFFFGWVPPHAFECLVALIAGLTPADPVVMPLHPALLPRYRLRGEWVLQWRHDFASLSSHRDVV
jgi:hypothetical protein